MPDRLAMIEAGAKQVREWLSLNEPASFDVAAAVLAVVRPLILREGAEAVRSMGYARLAELLEFDRVELLSALGAEVARDMGRLRAA